VTPRDFEPYVGIPWEDGGRTRAGADCWGLFRMVYAEMLGIDLPAYSASYPTALDREVTTRLVNGGKDDWIKVTEPRAGDGVLMYRMMRPHVGIVIGNGLMLHIEKGAGAVIESYQSLRVAGTLEGFYRYEAV